MPTTEELRAAAIAAESPVPIETETAVPQPYEIKEVDGGNYEVLIQGQVFKGSHKEVIAALAKAQANATDLIKTQKSKITEYETKPVIQPAAPAPVDTTPPEIAQAREYLLNETATALGLKDANELRSAFGMMQNVSQNQVNEAIAAGFQHLCPDYPESPENNDKLIEFTNKNGFPFTPQGLRAAHSLLIQEKAYTPLTAEQIQAQRMQALGISQNQIMPPNPAPPLPVNSSATPSAEFNPYDRNVPLDKVREWAAKNR